MRKRKKQIKCRIALLSILLFCTAVLSGCGSRIVFTRGFGGEELLRVGNAACSVAEYKVLLLDLQTECEKTFGSEVWQSAQGEELRKSIEQRALSESARIEVMFLLAVQDNIMLTNAEEAMAAEAEQVYYNGLSDAQKEYLDIDEDALRRLFRLYALAGKVYNSVGSSFEERYDAFAENLDYDLNETRLHSVSLLEGEDAGSAPGFSDTYEQYFDGSSGTASWGTTQSSE